MSSYFVNSTFPGSLPNGQDSFVGQIPLYSSGYEALRHFPGSYGTSPLQDKSYSSPCFYQQSSTVIACNRNSYDYGTSCFYPDKDSTSNPSSYPANKRSHTGDYLHFSTEQQYKSTNLQGKMFNEEANDRKYSNPVYPWMQRANSCAGKSVIYAETEQTSEDRQGTNGVSDTTFCLCFFKEKKSKENCTQKH